MGGVNLAGCRQKHKNEPISEQGNISNCAKDRNARQKSGNMAIGVVVASMNRQETDARLRSMMLWPGNSFRRNSYV